MFSSESLAIGEVCASGSSGDESEVSRDEAVSTSVGWHGTGSKSQVSCSGVVVFVSVSSRRVWSDVLRMEGHSIAPVSEVSPTRNTFKLLEK